MERLKEGKQQQYPVWLVFVLGAVFGMVFICALYYGRQAYNLRSNQYSPTNMPPTITLPDTIKNVAKIKEFVENQLKNEDQKVDDKIKSLNDRTGDLYLSLTIIVAVLIVFNIGVFFHARHEAKIDAEEYLSEHIDNYEADAKKMLTTVQDASDEVVTLISTLKSETLSVLEMKKSMQEQSVKTGEQHS